MNKIVLAFREDIYLDPNYNGCIHQILWTKESVGTNNTKDCNIPHISAIIDVLVKNHSDKKIILCPIELKYKSIVNILCLMKLNGLDVCIDWDAKFENIKKNMKTLGEALLNNT